MTSNSRGAEVRDGLRPLFFTFYFSLCMRQRPLKRDGHGRSLLSLREGKRPSMRSSPVPLLLWSAVLRVKQTLGLKQLIHAKTSFCFVFEKTTLYVGQASFKLEIFSLAQSLKCWDYGDMPPCQTEVKILNDSLCDLVSKFADVPINLVAPRIHPRKDSIVTSGLLVQDHKLGIRYKVTVITEKKRNPLMLMPSENRTCLA